MSKNVEPKIDIATRLLNEARKKAASNQKSKNASTENVTLAQQVETQLPAVSAPDPVKDLLSPESLEQMTVDQIDSLFDKINSDQSYDSDYFKIQKSSGGKKLTKTEKIQLLTNLKLINCTDTALASRSVTYPELTLDDVCLHPDNVRTKLDYYDPSLKESVRRAGNSSIKDIVISSKKVLCEDGKERYPAIAGNRNLFQHFEICDEDGLTRDSYHLTFKMIEYSGDDELASLQELRDIYSDNNASLQPSHLDKVSFGCKLLTKMTQANAAKELGISASAFSNYRQCLVLPNCVKKHIDIHDKTSHYERSFTPQQLSDNQIRFSVDGDSIKVYGINVQSALLLVKIWNYNDDEQVKLDLENLVKSEECITNACLLSTKDFNRWLINQDIVRQSKVFGSSKSYETSEGTGLGQKIRDGVPVKEAINLAKESTKDVAQAALSPYDRAKKNFEKEHSISWDTFKEDYLKESWSPHKNSFSFKLNEVIAYDEDEDTVALFKILIEKSIIIPKQN